MNTMKFYRSNCKGTTLFELLLAITLLGVIMIPVTAYFSTSMLTLKKTKIQIENNFAVKIIKEDVLHKYRVFVNNTNSNLENWDVLGLNKQAKDISLSDTEDDKYLYRYKFDVMRRDPTNDNQIIVKVYRHDDTKDNTGNWNYKLIQTVVLEQHKDNQYVKS